VVGGGARYWKHSDFKGLPASAVATALSRLSREGTLRRAGKGVYYRPVQTSFGLSIAPASVAAAQTLRAPVQPAGLSAANALGLTTQNPGKPVFATSAPKAPTALRGATVHTGRPNERAKLSAEEGAILEILRERARSSDLPAKETAQRLGAAISDVDSFARLTTAALAEPPRVRAMLGALGEELQMSPTLLARLRASLNPLSRFDFGPLRVLGAADKWQAK
jgi:Family of unknown function (DUF6088)